MIKYVFGPVPSRRLGISLGLDVIPFKTCSLNCIYCECGKTTDLTIERKSYFDYKELISQLKDVLNRGDSIDYITFSGSGEPLLNKDIGKIIEEIKNITNIKIAILTNGTLLYEDKLRKEILDADIVLPSLDAADDITFKKINNPHKSLKIDNIINGLIEFRKIFKNEIWLEVFIVEGINDSGEPLKNIHDAIKKINPDRVQLNSLDRPPAFDNVKPVDIKKLEMIKKEWNDLNNVEIIKRIKNRREIKSFSQNLENNILNTIKRRPLTIEDLENLTGMKRVEIYKYIDVLEREKKIYEKIINNKIFFNIIKN